jgi:hypothetical protein
MEQMWEWTLVKMDSFQEDMKTDREEMKEAIRTNQEKKDATIKEITENKGLPRSNGGLSGQ